MAVHTERKVKDLIIGQDNYLDLNTLSQNVKVYTNCPDTYINKPVSGGQITLSSEDVEFLNNGLISFEDSEGNITATPYYIPNGLNSCSDVNANNISKLYEKISSGNVGGGSAGDIDLSAIYGRLDTLDENFTKLIGSRGINSIDSASDITFLNDTVNYAAILAGLVYQLANEALGLALQQQNMHVFISLAEYDRIENKEDRLYFITE